MRTTLKSRNQYGQSLVTLLIAAGIGIAAALGAGQLIVNNKLATKRAIEMGIEEDVRQYVRQFTNCTQIAQRAAAACDAGNYIAGWSKNARQLVTTTPASNGIKVGDYTIRMRCQKDSEADYSLTPQVRRDGTDTAFRNLFDQPIICQPLVCGSFQQCKGTATECMAQADSGLGITVSAATAKTTLGSETVLRFFSTNNGTATNRFTVANPGKVYVLAVGGGGGAGGWQTAGGAGGAGGVKRGLLTVCPGTHTVTVGAGGIGYANSKSFRGANSIIGGFLTARGGGTSSGSHQDGCPIDAGRSFTNQPPSSGGVFIYPGGAYCVGGSGGGGTPLWGKTWPGGRTYGDPDEEGNIGGLGYERYPNNPAAGGGGGGAGTPGTNATITKAGDGGNGIQSDITGVMTWYAGGGGGGRYNGSSPGTGGLGGGGNGCAGNGAANTGGGAGGGCNSGAGGRGGSGIIVVRYN